MTSYCEFIGDPELDPDQLPSNERKCQYLGFKMPEGENFCTLESKPLDSNAEGWVVCCDTCPKPHHSTESTT